jgi:RNA polymerase sigma-70 factor (ECF subfamily)
MRYTRHSDCGSVALGYSNDKPMTPTLADPALMKRVRTGDPRAFRELYDRHSARAMGVAMAVTRNPRHAEEAVQDAFLDVWRARDRYDEARGSVSGWVMRIVRNRALDVVRRAAARERPWEPIEQCELADTAADPPEITARREERRTVRAAVRALPQEQATALGMAYFGGLTQVEVADALGVPLGTVKSRMRLGLGRLSRELPAADGPALATA